MAISVCHVVHWPRSGIGKVVEHLIEFGSSDTHYHVVTFNHCEQFAGKLESLGVKVETLDSRWSALTGLSRRLRELRPDIIHSHSLYPILLARWSGAAGSRRIATLHTLYGYLYRNDLKSMLKRWLFCAANRIDSETVTAVSKEIVETIPCGHIRNKTLTVENGIPTATVLELAKADPPLQLRGSPRILSIGRLDKEKGFPILLEAFARILAQYPNATLTIVGEGSERNRLEDIIARFGIGDHVSLPGHVNNPFPVLRQADLFVNSSTAEGFGLTLAEAMTLGIPVAATLTAGVSAALSDGGNGYVADGFSAEHIEALLNRALRDPGRRDIANRGRELALKRYGIMEMVHSYERLYGHVASNVRKKRFSKLLRSVN